jgi:dTDP-4-dehydrorhamnose 3,5-epimerase-like enzyme
MKILNTKFNGLKTVEGIKFDDSRGYFREIFLKKLFKKKKFIFWCMSKSKKMFLEECTYKQKAPKQKLYRLLKEKY